MINDADYMQDPQGRTRFFGIYEGIVKEINDPLKKGRIKVQVRELSVRILEQQL
jgi:hypothetical protein